MNKHENDFNKLMFDKDGIVLKPLLDEDIPLFDRWLNKDYIYKWLCPDGEEQREAWLDEVNNRNGKYGFIRHFIVYYKDKKIGYCLFADCFFLKDLEEEGHDFESLYGTSFGNAFGLSPDFFQSAAFRPSIKSKDVQGFYHVGASTHPGGGIPMTLTCGRLAAEQIQKDADRLTKKA